MRSILFTVLGGIALIYLLTDETVVNLARHYLQGTFGQIVLLIAAIGVVVLGAFMVFRKPPY